jgi:branched-chain amino acid transport system substrate-binding protein
MTTLKRLSRFVALLCSTCLSAAAHADILVGIAGPLTGPNAAFGNELRIGASAAISSINAQGGINGELLSLVEGDDACDAKRALDVAKSFTSQDVRLVVGHFCTYASLAAAPIYANAGVLMVTPTSTATIITNSRFWNVFRLAGRDDLQAETAARKITMDAAGAEVVVITDDSPRSAALLSTLKSALPNAKSFKVRAGSAKLPEDPSLLTATAAYVALEAGDAGSIAADLRKVNPAIALYGPDSLQTETYATKAGAAADGTRLTFQQDWTAIADPKRLTTLASSEGSTLAAYAAVEVFAAAAKARGVNNARSMAGWLAAGPDIPTIVGPLAFTPTGDLKSQPYTWLRWQNGALIPDTP